MAQHFSPGADTLFRAVLAAMVLALLAGLGVMLARPFTSHATGQGYAVPQPVQFSHAHHVGELGLDCRMCHQSVAQSRFAGMPPTHTCMTCHSQIWTEAAMLAPVRQSLARNTPLEWKRVHRLPDFVFFDHSVHVTNGVGCSTCHGPVQTMQQVYKAEPMTMAWCLSCHRDPAASLRPPDQIFNMEWTPPPDQRRRGEALMHHYGIKAEHLTDCSRCHR
jgi:hypothetical protein